MTGSLFEDDDRASGQQAAAAPLAERMREFVDANPEFETPLERFATWLARLDDDDDDAADAGGE